MRPLRFLINITLDGCCDHRAAGPVEGVHRRVVEHFEQADAILFGRATYQLMESAWRPSATSPAWPEWMQPFARAIDAAKKYVVSSTLARVDWNAELVRGEDLEQAVRRLKQQPGKGLFVAGSKLALALTELGLIDEYEFMVHPTLAGHGPTLFDGLTTPVELRPVGQLDLGSGVVAMRYVRA